MVGSSSVPAVHAQRKRRQADRSKRAGLDSSRAGEAESFLALLGTDTSSSCLALEPLRGTNYL